jgi:hypothetical protein
MSGARDNIHGMYEGVASLPLPDDMYSEESQNMAQGGIVAFQTAGNVDSSENPEANVKNTGSFFDALKGLYNNIVEPSNKFVPSNPTPTSNPVPADAAQKLAPPTTNFNPLNPWANVGKNPVASAAAPAAAPANSNVVYSQEDAANMGDVSRRAPAAAPASTGATTGATTGASTGATNTNVSNRTNPYAPNFMVDATQESPESMALTRQLTASMNLGTDVLNKALNRPETVVEDQAAIMARQKKARDTELKAQGLPSEQDSFNSRVSTLKQQGETARKDRDVDRWMAVAQGFFAMGAGQSRYALQNISKGLGITTTELSAVEKDYRKGELFRSDKEDTIRERQRALARGDLAAAETLHQKQLELAEKESGAKATVASNLLSHTAQVFGYNQAARENKLTRVQTAQIAAAGHELTAKIAAAANAQGRAQHEESLKAYRESALEQKRAEVEAKRQQQYFLYTQHFSDKDARNKSIPTMQNSINTLYSQHIQNPSNNEIKAKYNASSTALATLQDAIYEDAIKKAKHAMSTYTGDGDFKLVNTVPPAGK